MNFTLTPGVYAALNLLSKTTRSKVLDAAFAFVICGTRPTNLSKNLLVMFMMVVDSASGGQLTYVPDEQQDEIPAEEPIEEEQPQLEEEVPTAAEENIPESQPCVVERPQKSNNKAAIANVKRVTVHHRPKRKRILVAKC